MRFSLQFFYQFLAVCAYRNPCFTHFQTASAIRAEVVCVIYIAEQCGFELGVVHAPTIARVACGALVDNSYSSGARRLLYVWRGETVEELPA
jgi:hypothetical protein